MSINRELSQLASFIDVQEGNNFIGISTGGTYTVGIGTSSVTISSNGTITANSFVGATGSSLIDHIDLQDEGSLVGTGFTTLNFVGAAVTITQGVTGVATITVESAAVSGDDGQFQYNNGGSLGGTEVYYNDINDLVGIGTTQPTAKLDVDGTLNVSGIVTATSFVKSSNSGGFLKADGIEDTNTYLTTESQTLDDVVGLGSDTTQTITVGTATTGVVIRPDGTLNVSGVSTFQSNVHLGDSVELRLGTGNDLKIYHNGNNGFVSNVDTGDLNISGDDVIIASSTFENKAKFITDGAVELYHDNSKKFETTGIGVSIVGTGNTATISGPSNLVLDPSPVGVATTSGTVIILGDLQVDGTQTIINSTTLEVDDKLVSIAKSATNSTQADGAGLEINGASATFTYASSGDKWVANKSIEALGFATTNGTSSQFLKADGSVDSSTYITSADGGDAATLGGISSTSFLRSDAVDIKTSGNLTFNDSINLQLGTSGALKLYHNGSNSYIKNATGNLHIENQSNDSDIIIRTDDGSGSDTDYFRADGSTGESILYHYGTQKFATKSGGVTVTGILTATSFVKASNSGGFLKADGVEDTSTYLTSYTETQTLDDVVGLGSDTSQTITVGTATTGVVIRPDGTLNVSGIVTATSFSGAIELSSDTTPQLGGTLDTDGNLIQFADGDDATATLNRLQFGDSQDLQIYHDSDAGSKIQHDGSGSLYVQAAGNTEDLYLIAGRNIRIQPSGGEEGIKLNLNGSVEIYHDNVKKFETTGYGVTITGGIHVSGVATATDFNSASDENLKTNIRTIEDPLAKVVQIRGVNFDWKETQRPSLGVIAQEVERVLPELVTDNGTKTVNYNGLIGLLIETVKEQQKQIDTLSERLSKLE